MTLPEFQAFDKIPRLNREVVLTEKIDGTNAQIVFQPDDTMLIGSRSRWITPDDDNYGFARWVTENKENLKAELGYGQHFGEWWGKGIQRGYNLTEKRFSLFNTTRWNNVELKLCHVVPELWRGNFCDLDLPLWIDTLKIYGSWASKGYMLPEGIIIFHTAANRMFKATCKNDDKAKGEVK